MDKIDKICDYLNKNNQEELACQIYNLKDMQIANKRIKIDKLIKSIKLLDFSNIARLYELTQKEMQAFSSEDIEKIDYIDSTKFTSSYIEELENIGKQNLEKYAIVTLAGGQGTRLEHDGPKGTYELNIFGKKQTLFSILAKKIEKANKMYNISIPWYIMTSNENNVKTVQYFEKNNNFGLDITFFKQKDQPLLDKMGNLLIDKDFEIKKASDGNGSVFESLKDSGLIAKMKEDGTEYIFISGVDNCLVKLVDLAFLGEFVKSNEKIASKSVVKSDPYEKVGVFCKLNGKPKVIEYSEMPDNLSQMKNTDGSLLFSQSNIVCHMFTIEALEEISNKIMPYHFANKKNRYLNQAFIEVKPNENNTYKFETYIFDSFSFFDDMLIYMVNREEEFAPIKNKEGQDSPKTAKILYENYLKSKGLN